MLALLRGVSRPDLPAAFLGYRLILAGAAGPRPRVLIAGLSLGPGSRWTGPAASGCMSFALALLAAAGFSALSAVLILTGIAQIDPDRLQLQKGPCRCWCWRPAAESRWSPAWG